VGGKERRVSFELAGVLEECVVCAEGKRGLGEYQAPLCLHPIIFWIF
jgi:hypothetical protein